MAITEQTPLEQDFLPDYHLDAEQLKQIELKMIEDARAVAPDSIVISWVDPTHEYSNFLRTKEAENFPEVAETDMYYELNQVYLAVVDTRGTGSVAHAATINFYDDTPTLEDASLGAETITPRTGFYTVDSLIQRENFTKEEFAAYYAEKGIDLNTTISIETNFKINQEMPLYEDYLGSADLVYLAMFQWGLRQKWDYSTITVFATINEKQINSFKRLGISVAPLMGRTDLKTEEDELGKYSFPVTVDFMSLHDVLSGIGLDLPIIEYKSATTNN